MIWWCAYCQRYLGEAAPFDSYELTHGICGRCLADDHVLEPETIARVTPIRDYYEALRRTAREHQRRSPDELVAQGLDLGLDPGDVAIGMLQPLLEEFGACWASGELPVSDEHRLSALVGAMFEICFVRRPELAERRDVADPDILLVGAPSNYHELGPKLLQLLLASRGIKTHLVSPGVPVKDCVALARELRPKVLGLSIALDEQLPATYAVAAALRALPDDQRPLVCVGGRAVVCGLAVDETRGVVRVPRHDDLIPLLGRA